MLDCTAIDGDLAGAAGRGDRTAADTDGAGAGRRDLADRALVAEEDVAGTRDFTDRAVADGDQARAAGRTDGTVAVDGDRAGTAGRGDRAVADVDVTVAAGRGDRTAGGRDRAAAGDCGDRTVADFNRAGTLDFADRSRAVECGRIRNIDRGDRSAGALDAAGVRDRTDRPAGDLGRAGAADVGNFSVRADLRLARNGDRGDFSVEGARDAAGVRDRTDRACADADRAGRLGLSDRSAADFQVAGTAGFIDRRAADFGRAGLQGKRADLAGAADDVVAAALDGADLAGAVDGGRGRGRGRAAHQIDGPDRAGAVERDIFGIRNSRNRSAADADRAGSVRVGHRTAGDGKISGAGAGCVDRGAADGRGRAVGQRERPDLAGTADGAVAAARDFGDLAGAVDGGRGSAALQLNESDRTGRTEGNIRGIADRADRPAVDADRAGTGRTGDRSSGDADRAAAGGRADRSAADGGRAADQIQGRDRSGTAEGASVRVHRGNRLARSNGQFAAAGQIDVAGPRQSGIDRQISGGAVDLDVRIGRGGVVGDRHGTGGGNNIVPGNCKRGAIGKRESVAKEVRGHFGAGVIGQLAAIDQGHRAAGSQRRTDLQRAAVGNRNGRRPRAGNRHRTRGRNAVRSGALDLGTSVSKPEGIAKHRNGRTVRVAFDRTVIAQNRTDRQRVVVGDRERRVIRSIRVGVGNRDGPAGGNNIAACSDGYRCVRSGGRIFITTHDDVRIRAADRDRAVRSRGVIDRQGAVARESTDRSGAADGNVAGPRNGGNRTGADGRRAAGQRKIGDVAADGTAEGVHLIDGTARCNGQTAAFHRDRTVRIQVGIDSYGTGTRILVDFSAIDGNIVAAGGFGNRTIGHGDRSGTRDFADRSAVDRKRTGIINEADRPAADSGRAGARNVGDRTALDGNIARAAGRGNRSAVDLRGRVVGQNDFFDRSGSGDGNSGRVHRHGIARLIDGQRAVGHRERTNRSGAADGNVAAGRGSGDRSAGARDRAGACDTSNRSAGNINCIGTTGRANRCDTDVGRSAVQMQIRNRSCAADGSARRVHIGDRAARTDRQRAAGRSI